MIRLIGYYGANNGLLEVAIRGFNRNIHFHQPIKQQFRKWIVFRFVVWKRISPLWQPIDHFIHGILEYAKWYVEEKSQKVVYEALLWVVMVIIDLDRADSRVRKYACSRSTIEKFLVLNVDFAKSLCRAELKVYISNRGLKVNRYAKWLAVN